MSPPRFLGQIATTSIVCLFTACGGDVGNDTSNGGATSNGMATGGRSSAGGAIASGGSSGSKSVGGTLSAGGGVAGGVPNTGGGYSTLGGTGASTGGATVCIPTKTIADCQAAGIGCDAIPDGCGGLFSCGTCLSPETCGGAGVAFQCGGGGPPTCSNFCVLVPNNCAADTDTVLHGTVWSPAGNPAIDPSRGEVPLPIPNAMVYVPNGSTTPPYGLSAFTDGVASGCDCSVQGPPLNIFPSGVDGSFTVTGVPAGVDIPLVIQLGRWRRVVTIPAAQAPACAGRVELTADQTRLPRRQVERDSMDSIPLMALSTGQADALECVLRKMGVEDSQFSNGEDSGNGRIRLYRQTNPSTAGSTSGAPGASCTKGGGSCVGTTPSYATLVSSQASVDRYDALLFPCNGTAHDESTQAKTLILDNATNAAAYVNKGGRALFTHFSYAWLYNQPPSNLLPWASTSTGASVSTQWDTAYSLIDRSFARSATFEGWLNLSNVNVLTGITPFPYVTLTEVRRDLANTTTWPFYSSKVIPLYAQRWIYHPQYMVPPSNTGTTSVDSAADSIQHLTFDTPYGDSSTTLQCGRVAFSSFHVTSAELSKNACITGTGSSASDTNCSFPAECGTSMDNQEKILAYMLFDLTATVCPRTLRCQPLDCTAQGVVSGPASDGCGNVIHCLQGNSCTPVNCETSCANQGSTCRTLPDPTKPTGDTFPCIQPDGCGSTLDCYCLLG